MSKAATPLSRLRSEAFRRQKNEDLRTALKELESQNAVLKEQISVFKALESKKPTNVIPTYAGTTSDARAIPIIMLSDWHAEERVRPGDVPGVDNRYDVNIFRSRARRVAQGGLYLTETCRNMAEIDTLCLWFGGDLISGHIHDELVEGNSVSPVKACTELVYPMLTEYINFFLEKGRFKKIVIVANYGNHGRDTITSRASTGADHSYEWFMYHMLKKAFANEKRLEWHIADGYHQYVKFFNTTIRFHHGDAIQYQGGIGGITIPINKAIAAWNSIKNVDLDVMGHFHQMTDGGNVLVNGSLIGYGAYALRAKCRYEVPQQMFALIDKNKGKTLTAKIFAS